MSCWLEAGCAECVAAAAHEPCIAIYRGLALAASRDEVANCADTDTKQHVTPTISKCDRLHACVALMRSVRAVSLFGQLYSASLRCLDHHLSVAAPQSKALLPNMFEDMSLCGPSAISMLPENNKTTAKADSDCVHKIAFLKEVSEEFGTKPPPRKSGQDVLRSSASSLAELQTGCAAFGRAKACEWPDVLEPVLRHLDVKTLTDGACPFNVAK